MIVSRLKQYVQDEANKTARKPKNLTASIILTCRRRLAYIMREEGVAELDVDLLLRFHDGYLHHRDFDELLGKLDYLGLQLLETEVPLIFKCNGVSIYSRIDFRVKDKEMGVINGEFKSMNRDSFLLFSNEGLDAFPNYYAQCQVGLNAQPTVPFIIVAKNKDSGEYIEYFVDLDKDFGEKLAQRKAEFDKEISEDRLPDRDFEYNSGECRNCDYKVRCWFGTIRDSVSISTDFSSKEIKLLNSLISELDSLEDTYNTYLEKDKILKDFIAFLHSKYETKKIKLYRISSSIVEYDKEVIDKNILKDILTDEQAEEVYSYKRIAFPRTIIRRKSK